jgi:hypothetical protein
MNKIEKLMMELCPNGVELKKLGELGEFENIGVDKKTVDGQKSVMLLNFMDIMRNKHITKDLLSMEVTASDSKIEKCDIKKHDIFITPTSETRDEIGFTAVVTEDILKWLHRLHPIFQAVIFPPTLAGIIFGFCKSPSVPKFPRRGNGEFGGNSG